MDVFSYVVGCKETGQGAVIDPGGEDERILQAAEEQGLRFLYIINTHHHFDHTEGNDWLKERTGADIVMHEADAALYNRHVDHVIREEGPFRLGSLTLSVYHTPGHTPGGICLYAQGTLFTGDTLFVGDSGRTDLPGGHRPTLGASIRKLMQLPPETVVCPGHDYGPTPTSTLEWEQRHNVNAREYGFLKKS
jgi:glyoxylase-like metal-dependent hydrolase (beta-lactamase superfamily II)